jgi:hypothetical protein
VFLKVVVWWLRLFGFRKKIILWSDGGTEFQASMRGTFERVNEYFFEPLGIERKIIRKGHPEEKSLLLKGLIKQMILNSTFHIF